MLSGVISTPESDVGIWRVFTKVTRNSPFSGPQVLGAVLRDLYPQNIVWETDQWRVLSLFISESSLLVLILVF